MMYSAYIAFDIGNECMNLLELVETFFVFHENHIPVLESLRFDHSVSRPSVGSNSTALLAGLIRANEHVVHCHQTGQLIVDVSIRHCLAYLVPYQSGGLGALDINQSLHLQNGHATLLTRHEQNHPEPLPKGSACLMKDRFGSHRDLVITGAAFKKMMVMWLYSSWPQRGYEYSSGHLMRKRCLSARVLIGKTILELKKIYRFSLHWFNPSLCVGGGNVTPTEQCQ